MFYEAGFEVLKVHYNMINLRKSYTSFQFLYFLTKSKYFQREFKNLKRASVQDYVVLDEVEKIEIVLPDNITLMKEIDSYFISIFNKISNNNKEIQTLTKLRDTLLPKLMSGELRINHN